MLLNSFEKRISRPDCNHSFESLMCIAKTDCDIGCALPYLNAVLGGNEYFTDPPAVLFKAHGKIIKAEANEISINALKDEEEADKILEWLKNEINRAWENRDDITPKYEGMKTPQVLEILKLLPKNNCRECGLPTCMVFATQAAQGVRGPDDCPGLTPENKTQLGEYLSGFDLDF